MSFLLSEELETFSGILRKFFAAESTASFLRKRLLHPDVKLPAQKKQGERPAASGAPASQPGDGPLWSAIVQLGATAAPIPESADGLGFGMLALQTIVQESAATLFPLPLFETLALGVAPLLALNAEAEAGKVLSQIAAGQTKLSGAWADNCIANYILPAFSGKPVSKPSETSSEFNSTIPSGIVSVLPADGSDFSHTVTGKLPFVPSVSTVNAILMPGVEESRSDPEERFGVYLLKLQGQPKDAVHCEQIQTFDLLRDFSCLTLKGARAQRVSPLRCTKAQWERVTYVLALLAASELAGVARTSIGMTVEHCKTRKQFGRAIGSFQVVQHALADMELNFGEVESLCRVAAWSYESDPSQFAQACVAAKAYASEVVPQILEAAIQAHGGIGFTFEHDLHLYLRRAKVMATLFGSSSFGYEQLGRLLLNQGPIVTAEI